MVSVQRATIELWMYAGGCYARKKRKAIAKYDSSFLSA